VNLVQVEIKTDKETRKVCGTLSPNKKPRIVKMDNYYFELSPQGEIVLVQNRDVPGIIGALGTLFGENGINIATMTFGREKMGGMAISLLNVDSTISSQMLEKVRKIKDILSAKVIRI